MTMGICRIKTNKKLLNPIKQLRPVNPIKQLRPVNPIEQLRPVNHVVFPSLYFRSDSRYNKKVAVHQLKHQLKHQLNHLPLADLK